MSMLQSVGTVIALVGIAIRLVTWRRYFDAYAAKHSSSPPRSWLFARDPDPTIEKARFPLVVGTSIAFVGIVLLIIGAVSG